MTDYEGGDGTGAGYTEEQRSSNPDTSDRENVCSFQRLADQPDTVSASHVILDHLLIRNTG
jgi:hypothetical protein